MTLLLVEDDPELARQLATALRDAGHHVTHAANGKESLKLALQYEWDVILMDVTLPGMSGYDVVQQLRDNSIVVPVIFLTARAEVSDRVHGLSVGGDDYLTKPFAMAELVARLDALHRRFRRTSASPTGPQLPKGWKLDSIRRSVTIGIHTIELQPREWSLLDVFLNNQGKILTKTFLLDKVWNVRFDPGTNVVDAAVFRLRRKLDQPDTTSHIETRRGEGYLFHRHDPA